jgi:hypothetical protein
MLKRMFIYLLLCTFGLLNVPKVYWHDCERQHLHASYDHEHSHDEAQISSSDDCSICDFQFFHLQSINTLSNFIWITLPLFMELFPHKR